MHIRWEVIILSPDLERRRELAKILTSNGIEFAYASSIEDCKEIVARESVGLIFWDGYLADGACRDLLDSIWSLDRRVKIVLMPHGEDRENHEAIERTGAFGVVPFPCQPTDIEWILSRALRAERAEDKLEHSRAQHLHS
jgi:DNA-binding NtrC family response regulator